MPCKAEVWPIGVSLCPQLPAGPETIQAISAHIFSLSLESPAA